MTREILGRLRFPDEFTDKAARAVREHMYPVRDSAGAELPDANLRRFIRRVGAGNIERQFALRRADALGHGMPDAVLEAHNIEFQNRVRAVLDLKPAVSVRDMPLRGQDVIAVLVREGVFPAGYKGDRTVGVILDSLLEMVIEDPRPERPGRPAGALRRAGARDGRKRTRGNGIAIRHVAAIHQGRRPRTKGPTVLRSGNG